MRMWTAPDPWDQHHDNEQHPQDEPDESPSEMLTDSEAAHAPPRTAERHLRAAERPGVPPHSDPVERHCIAQEQSASAHPAEAEYNEWSLKPDEW
jgi:hypothetical protein